MITEAFKNLSRTQKCEFVSSNIEYASARAVAEFIKGYLFDVLKDVNDDEYIANYLKERGYTVTKD